ncbi:MAG: TonB-dependent receptor [Paludibacteraceae bacterium]|nr:TonB-dependent receptor [Paludibacteraceae bacterium]
MFLTICQASYSIPADSIAAARRRFHIDEVQVVADKADRRADTYRLVSTVSREEIAALPVTNVADILQYLPGLDIRHRGANGAQTDLLMRGGTFDQVLVMLNGIPLNDAQTGHYSLHLPVSPLLIERIEVLQDAVNIITTSPQNQISKIKNPKSKLRLTAGMNGLCQPSAAGSWQLGEWQLNASAEYSRSDGYYAPAPSDKEREALTNNGCRWANIYLQTRWRDLDVQLGAQYKDAGAGLFYGGSTDQFDATRTAFGSARYKHHWGAWSLEGKASYRANYDHYEWHRGQPAGSNTHLLQTAAAGLQAAYISWLGTTSAGVELRNENIGSTNLGDTNRVNLTYFARQTFHYNRLNASLGLSGNYNTFFGNHMTGSANIGYEYLPGSSVYLNAQRAVRMPTFTDLYYDAGNQLGNPDLQPEKAWTFSIGGTYANSGFRLTADAWYRLGTNIIDWVFVPSDTRRPYHAMNQQRINSAGTELTALYQPSADSRQPAVLSQWLRLVKLSYAYTWLDLDLHESQSRYLDYLSHKFVFGLEHGIWVSRDPQKIGVIAASWTLRWQKREGDYTAAEPAADGTPVVMPYQPVLLLDGALYWQNAHVKLSAECTNITNRHYYDYGSLLMPGAWGTLSLEVKF